MSSYAPIDKIGAAPAPRPPAGAGAGGGRALRPVIRASAPVAVYAYGNALVVECQKREILDIKRPLRGHIRAWSKASRRRLAYHLGAMPLGDPSARYSVLTYSGPTPESGPEVKRHLGRLLRRLQASFPTLWGLWTIEFCASGRAHVNLVTVGAALAQPDVLEAWTAATGRKSRCYCQPIRSKAGLPGYLHAELLKVSQRTPPQWFRHVGRFWARFGEWPAPVPVEIDPAQAMRIIRRLSRQAGYEIPRHTRTVWRADLAPFVDKLPPAR